MGHTGGYGIPPSPPQSLAPQIHGLGIAPAHEPQKRRLIADEYMLALSKEPEIAAPLDAASEDAIGLDAIRIEAASQPSEQRSD